MITEKSKVSFDYTLTVDGEVMDSSQGKEPLAFTMGEKQIIGGLEKEMLGLKVDDEKKVEVAPEEGYGPVMPEAIQEFPKTQMHKDVEPKVGMLLQLQNNEGHAMPAQIIEVKDDTVVIDMNHPLAGKTLTFDVKIVKID